MKKVFFSIIVLIFGITFVNASSCVITSGTGKNVGDEIRCGSEQFYVMSNDGENVKMMGKYNLLAGDIYDYIELDNYQYKYANDIYKNKEIQERINKYGVKLNNITRTYDSTTETYTATAASGSKSYTEDYKIVVLDEELATTQELINQEKIKEVLEQGYMIDETLSSNSKYFGAIFYKDLSLEYKTVFLDGTSKSLGELMKTPKIKELIEQGYNFYEQMYYNNIDNTNGEYKYGCYALTLVKSKWYDYITIVLDEKITTSNHSDFKTNYIDSNEQVQQKISEGYIYIGNEYEYNSTAKKYNYYGIVLRKHTNYYNQIKQDEKAIGIRGSSSNPQYPFYGVFNQYDYYDEKNEKWNSLGNIVDGADGKLYGGGHYKDYNSENFLPLVEYKETLADMGYSVKSVSMPTVQELNDMTKELIGLELPLEEWYENRTAIRDEEGNIKTYIVGSIKDFYNGKHSWLWATSYWLGTISPTSSIPETYYNDIYDMNTLGDLCLTDSCVNSPSRGIRPVVTISTSELIYDVKTKTDGNGTVEATHVEAKNGDQVKFTVTPKKGYDLKEIKVTDEAGNVVIFTDYTFVMPSSNVTIEASFTKIENPNTTSISIVACIIFTIVSIIIIKLNYSKLRWIEE